MTGYFLFVAAIWILVAVHAQDPEWGRIFWTIAAVLIGLAGILDDRDGGPKEMWG